MLPRKYVAAVLLVRKLYRWKYWGGTREKNFLWVDDLAKGRGVDVSLADIIPEVASDLCQEGILQPKYGSAGARKKGQKYALNGERRCEIELIVRQGYFQDERLRHHLMRDRNEVPRDWLTWEVEVPGRRDHLLGPNGQMAKRREQQGHAFQ
jgi:hypothetical protein